MRECDEVAPKFSKLEARNHDIWRMPLAVAWWLQQDHDVGGLSARMNQLSESYLKLKQDYPENLRPASRAAFAVAESIFG